MLSRAQWYREQANLACNEVMKRATNVRAGFDELCANGSGSPSKPSGSRTSGDGRPQNETRAGIELGVESPSTVPLSTAGTSSRKRALRNAQYVQKA